MKNIYKLLLSILSPILMFILGYITCNRAATFTLQQLQAVFYAPYIILVLAAILAWRFNRSRSFFMSVIFILALIAIYYQKKAMPALNDIIIVLSILLPFNVILFTFLKERGILSIWGMLRFGFILIQAGSAYWITLPEQQKIFNRLNAPLFPVKDSNILSLSHIALIVFIISFVLLVLRVILYQASPDISFACLLITLFYLFNRNKPVEYSIYFTVIGMILIISILKDTYSMAFYDELTGLPSRRALNQDLMKLGMKYSIAMLDIDFFKKFNDTYGHDTGDEALKFISAMLKDVKCGGKAYRYGGEEFTILFPGRILNDVLPSLEELREGIANRGFIIRRKRRTKFSSKRKTAGKTKRRSSNTGNARKIHIHVSIGAAHKDDLQKTPDMVLKAADTALYRAKKKGRNCVCK